MCHTWRRRIICGVLRWQSMKKRDLFEDVGVVGNVNIKWLKQK